MPTVVYEYNGVIEFIPVSLLQRRYFASIYDSELWA